MNRKRVIVWFRQDLRIHDNEALTDALKSAEEVIPVYVFDERVFKGRSRFEFRKTEKFRARFIIESVHDLRKSLQSLGSDLVVRVGKPEEIIFEIAQRSKASLIFCNRERTDEEVKVQDALEENLWSIGREIIYSRGKMLYYTQDLPFPVTHCPDTFAGFKKEVERLVPVRKPLPSPAKKIKPFSTHIKPGEIPALQNLGYEDFDKDPRAVIDFSGGETQGLKHLKNFLKELNISNQTDQNAAGLPAVDLSSKFSAWLSQGCLSPKMIYHELHKLQPELSEHEGFYKVYNSLLKRDFYRLIGKKFGNAIFQKGGIIKQTDPNWKNDRHLMNVWIEGRTGIPFVDANMRALKYSGYMPTKGRGVAASFLVDGLGVNWQMGAEYFESMLIDYDPCSNWGNWNAIAGVGSDFREQRSVNVISRSKKYDPEGVFIRKWIRELADVPNEKIHLPDTMSEEEQIASHVRIGQDYPKAMLSASRWM